MDDDKDLMRAHDMAHSIAVGELLRLIISEMAFDPDPERFRKRINSFEEAAVTSLSNRRNFPDTNDYTETVIKEAACSYVTRLLSSIRHPRDAAT